MITFVKTEWYGTSQAFRRRYGQVKHSVGGTAPSPYHSGKHRQYPLFGTARALYLLQSPTLAVPSKGDFPNPKLEFVI